MNVSGYPTFLKISYRHAYFSLPAPQFSKFASASDRHSNTPPPDMLSLDATNLPALAAGAEFAPRRPTPTRRSQPTADDFTPALATHDRRLRPSHWRCPPSRCRALCRAAILCPTPCHRPWLAAVTSHCITKGDFFKNLPYLGWF
jgi:hypothetical protein